MFSTLSAVYFSAGLPFGRLFGFREFNKANFNGNGNENNGCVSVRYNSLFISLLFFATVHKTTTRKSHLLHISENVNCLEDGKD